MHATLLSVSVVTLVLLGQAHISGAESNGTPRCPSTIRRPIPVSGKGGTSVVQLWILDDGDVNNRCVIFLPFNPEDLTGENFSLERICKKAINVSRAVAPFNLEYLVDLFIEKGVPGPNLGHLYIAIKAVGKTDEISVLKKDEKGTRIESIKIDDAKNDIDFLFCEASPKDLISLSPVDNLLTFYNADEPIKPVPVVDKSNVIYHNISMIKNPCIIDENSPACDTYKAHQQKMDANADEDKKVVIFFMVLMIFLLIGIFAALAYIFKKKVRKLLGLPPSKPKEEYHTTTPHTFSFTVDDREKKKGNRIEQFKSIRSDFITDGSKSSKRSTRNRGGNKSSTKSTMSRRSTNDGLPPFQSCPSDFVPKSDMKKFKSIKSQFGQTGTPNNTKPTTSFQTIKSYFAKTNPEYPGGSSKKPESNFQMVP